MRAVALLCAALAGCTGSISELTPLRPGDGEAHQGATRPRVCAEGERDVAGPRLLRRLSREELDASLRDVFGLDPSWGGPTVPPDPASPDGYTNHADLLRVNEPYATQLAETAEGVGALVADREGCADRACVERFIDVVGRRAYRRPLTEPERARYLALADQASGPHAAVRWAATAMAQSPHFLYRSELGAPGDGVATLDGWELATALAYTLTGAPPGDALLDRAESLTDPEVRRAVARELAFDADGAPRPAFAAQVVRFARGWLGLAALDNLGKRPDVYPDWSVAVRAAMADEVERFLRRVLLEERGSVRDLLTSRRTELDPVLAGYYGWGGEGVVERPDGWGAGVLSLGGVLAIGATNVATSPTQRGHFVRARVLCEEIDPPPPGVGNVPEPTAFETTRERYERIHASDAFCQGCHRMMDPIGFGLEHLDAAGRYRADEAGFSIDDTGAIHDRDPSVAPREFEGPEALASLLADDPNSARCVGSFAASHALGLSRADAECLSSSALDALVAERPLVDLWIELATTPHFDRRAL